MIHKVFLVFSKHYQIIITETQFNIHNYFNYNLYFFNNID